MQRLTRCMVWFGAVGALSAVSACTSGNPADNQGTPTEIVSNPDVVFLDQGQSEPVVVSVVDEDGQTLAAEFVLGNVGPGITVTPDPNFLPVTTGVPINRQARFFVQAVDLAASSFTVTALGLSKDIQVTSVPASLAATFSNATPALGDTITITAPVGTFFSQTSTISFGVQALVVTARAADGSSMTFIPAPTIHGPLSVTGVQVTSDPDLTFTLNTTETLITDSLVNVAATFSPTSTPALGQTVTLTLPATLKATPPASGLTIAAAPAPRAVAVAADSNSIAFIPAPNSDSVAIIPGVIHFRLPMYPLILPTTTKVTTPVVTVLPSTLSSTAPAVNVPVTLTSTDANFTFIAPAGVTVGAVTGAIITAQTASTITFLPVPASAGAVTVAPVDVAGFALALPSSAGAMTTGSTVPSLPGTDAAATAPVLAIPATVGGTTGLYDSGAFAANIATIGASNRVYRITAPGASSYRVTVNWDNAADIDVALCGEVTCATPNFAAATGSHPESTTYTFTGAGANYLVLNLFAGDVPGWVSIAITRVT